MAKSPYDTNLNRRAANYQPLTPLSLLEHAAALFPDHTAVIHGGHRATYATFYARARALASALARHGIARGDTVSAMLPNAPAMLEAHYGVPMTGAVLNAATTTLDTKETTKTFESKIPSRRARIPPKTASRAATTAIGR